MSDAVVSNPVAEAPSAEQSNEQNVAPSKETTSQKEKRIFKAKIEGREEQVDEDTLLRHYQKERAADKKLREAAQARKEVEAFYETLQNDPESILNDPRLPLKKRELAEKWLMESLKGELSEPEDPREKELADIKRELEKYKNLEKQTKEQKEQEEYQALVSQRKEAIAMTLSKAMSMSPLAQDPDTAAATLKEMATYMRMCRDAGYEASPEEIAQHVESRYNKSYHSLANKLEGDQLIQFLGEAVVNKIRKADLARIMKQREQAAPQQADSWQSTSNSGQKREILDPDQLRRQRR